MEIFIVVKHHYTVDSHLVRSNETAFSTRSAAEDHIGKLGNEELPDTGGLMKYAVRPLMVHENHDEWRKFTVKRAQEILEEMKDAGTDH